MSDRRLYIGSIIFRKPNSQYKSPSLLILIFNKMSSKEEKEQYERM